MPKADHADIHHFFPHPDTGHVDYDEDGDPYLGFYYQLLDSDGQPVSHLTGPYGAPEEAEEACQQAWLSGDY